MKLEEERLRQHERLQEQERLTQQKKMEDSHSNNSDEGILRGSSGEELDKKDYDLTRDSDG